MMDENELRQKYDELTSAFPQAFPNIQHITPHREYLGLKQSMHWTCNAYDRDGNSLTVRVFPQKNIILVEPEDAKNSLVDVVEETLAAKGYVTVTPTRESYGEDLAIAFDLERLFSAGPMRKPPTSEGYSGAFTPRKPPRSTTLGAKR